MIYDVMFLFFFGLLVLDHTQFSAEFASILRNFVRMRNF